MMVYFPGGHERLPHNVLIRKEKEKKKKNYHVICFPNFLFPTLIVQRFLIANCVFIAYLYNLTCHYRHIIRSCASLSRAIIHGILFKLTSEQKLDKIDLSFLFSFYLISLIFLCYLLYTHRPIYEQKFLL